MFSLSDGVKKALILIPTQPLPARTRVALRRKHLARLELTKAERASFLIIGHPKSGNTWLKVMLSRLYQTRYNLPESKLINTDQFTKRQSRAKQELINHFVEHPIDRRTVQMWEFVRHSDIGLPSLIEYQNTWARNVRELEHGMLTRYEDLRAQPVQTLLAITQLMGEKFSEEEIRAAVEWGSFDNLQKLETSGTFSQGGMKLVDASDPSTFKVRRGKVEGYREDFTPQQVAELEALVRATILPELGYCQDTADG